MSKKTTDQKTEKQAVKKQPTELKDDQLDAAQGGGRSNPDGSPPQKGGNAETTW